MTKNGMQRKLRAILSADVQGYSKLMGDDDEYTVSTITKYRNIITGLVEKHEGRVVDSPGDNILAEFSSALNAVNSAIEIQSTLETQNKNLPENRRMDFRIGINLGDIIHRDDRIYGDGVNIAARIESFADPGGICISRGVYDQIKKKIRQGFDFLGEHTVKNISEPVRIYRMHIGPEPEKKIIEAKKSKSTRKKSYAVIIAILVVTIATLIWIFYQLSPKTDPPSAENMAFPLHDKPSIAVLPFTNMGKDPEQEYFSDGITNDIITAFSKFKELLVIASNTIFTYKGKAVNIELIGQELSVKYVLEGSVQKAGSKIRINAQLIDTATGFHIWSEHYNRELEDIFAIQDEIVHTIVGKFAVEIDKVERRRAMQKKTENLEAYDYMLRGMEYLRRRTRLENRKARLMFEKAIDLDPSFASAYVGLGQTYQVQISFGWTEFPIQVLQQAKDLALKALSLEESNAGAYTLLGLIYTFEGQYDLAINKLNRAIELNPNDARSLAFRGQVLLWSGSVDAAIHSLETAYRFDPNMIHGNFMFLGIGYYLKGLYEKAINVLKEGVSRKPNWVGNHIILAAAYAQASLSSKAEHEAQEVLRLEPFFEIENYGTVFRNQADRAKIVQGLRKAGL
ncbi:MAG: tetratricopeptide repeat protein [Proteobacteria bacterium]|nr:tetratricopeptide repeat protein [Pseudomonadota bacterium]